MPGLKAALGRLVNEPSFATELRRDPAKARAGYHLTATDPASAPATKTAAAIEADSPIVESGDNAPGV